MTTVGNSINLATNTEYFADLKPVFDDVSNNKTVRLFSTSLVKNFQVKVLTEYLIDIRSLRNKKVMNFFHP